MIEQPTPLTRSDACLLAAATESNGKRPRRLRDLIADYDWLERGIPTFDEVSFGLPRLIAAGFLEVSSDAGKTVIRATPKARLLRSIIKAKTLGGVLSETAAAVGAAPYPEAETEDRREGRLSGLESAEWDSEVRAYHASWGTGLAKFFAAGGAAIAGAAVAVRIARGRRGRRGHGERPS
jgi:hypothetical protein